MLPVNLRDLVRFHVCLSVAPAREEPARTFADEVKDLLRGMNRTLSRSREESSRDGKLFCSCANLDFCFFWSIRSGHHSINTHTTKQTSRKLQKPRNAGTAAGSHERVYNHPFQFDVFATCLPSPHENPMPHRGSENGL